MLVLPYSAEARSRAAEVTSQGRVLAFRTDTFYGLGADPFNAGALRAVKRLKGREEGKPILVVVSDPHVVDRFVAQRNRLFQALAGRFWPGALTVVAAARESVPAELTEGTGTIGLRLPDDQEVRELVRACGGALTATSANPSGSPPARTTEQAARYFGDKVALYVDGGETRAEQPSTVIDVNGDDGAARLLREGAVSRLDLEAALAEAGARLARG